MNRLFTIILSVVWVLGAQQALAAEFIPLGDLPGGEFESVATDVSADGSVVVGQSASGPEDLEVFRWTSGTGMVELGDLPGGFVRGRARGVSGDGSVVVGQGSLAGPLIEAFRWTSAGGMVGIGDLAGGGFESDAQGVSADGSVVVGLGRSASGQEAFRWTSAGGMVGLGDLPGGDFKSWALGISADGSVVVGWSEVANEATEAFRWTSAGGMVGLGFLPGGDGSLATSVSANGSVVVGHGSSASGREAFRWTNADGMVGLGDLAGGEFESVAVGVSADGRVVVGNSSTGSGGDPTSVSLDGIMVAGNSKTAAGTNEGFIWTQANGMQRLEDILVANDTTGLSGWSELSAGGISDNGQWVVGTGTNPSGFEEAFLVQITDGINQGFQINPGLNGNWWNGLDRNGEGVQVEVSDGGGGSLILVATVYSYDDMGNQIFLIAVGTVDEDTAEVDVFITEGGLWGEAYDPALVNETQWGTGTFTASSCDAIHMELMPNAEFQGMGYANLMYDLMRLTTPAVPCPIDNPN